MKQIIGIVLIIFLCSGYEALAGNGVFPGQQTAHSWETVSLPNEVPSSFENEFESVGLKPDSNLHPRKKSYQLNSLNALKKPLYAVRENEPPAYKNEHQYPFLT